VTSKEIKGLDKDACSDNTGRKQIHRDFPSYSVRSGSFLRWQGLRRCTIGRSWGELKMERCSWCLCNEKMIKYHDEEWGAPLYDDRKQFEFLVMEVMEGRAVVRKIRNKED
jgi:hypothetical protein